MFWSKEKHDKRSTLVFKTKKGIKRSRPQNASSEQTNPNGIENQITENSESGRPNNEGENING